MWASSILMLIFIAAELPFGGTGEQGTCTAPEPKNNAKTPGEDTYSSGTFRMQCKDGFVRKAGTSNLFKCKENNWKNNPPLECISDPKRKPHIASTTEKTWCTTMGQTKTSSTASGQAALTTTHTVATTTGTSLLTTIRSTAKEANTITLSSSTALNVRENVTSVSPQSTPPSNIITTTVVNTSAQNLTLLTSGTTEKTWCTTLGKTTSTASDSSEPAAPFSGTATGGIAAGTIFLILVIAALAGVLLWSQRQKKSCRNKEMRVEAPDPVLPLLDRPTSPSNCPSDSVQYCGSFVEGSTKRPNSYIIC